MYGSICAICQPVLPFFKFFQNVTTTTTRTGTRTRTRTTFKLIERDARVKNQYHAGILDTIGYEDALF